MFVIKKLNCSMRRSQKEQICSSVRVDIVKLFEQKIREILAVHRTRRT